MVRGARQGSGVRRLGEEGIRWSEAARVYSFKPHIFFFFLKRTCRQNGGEHYGIHESFDIRLLVTLLMHCNVLGEGS